MFLVAAVPLTMVGYYFGYRKAPYNLPCEVLLLEKVDIPPQQWYMHPFVSMLLAGILPFGAVFIELFFILTVRV